METIRLRDAKKFGMGALYASIELVNEEDLFSVKNHLIGEEEVRQVSLTLMVDTGALDLVINENIQQILQLPVCGKEKYYLANGKEVECDVVDQVQIRFNGAKASCKAVVLPGEDAEPLLGVIPLEILRVVIDPSRQELMLNPSEKGDFNTLYSIRSKAGMESQLSIIAYKEFQKKARQGLTDAD